MCVVRIVFIRNKWWKKNIDVIMTADKKVEAGHITRETYHFLLYKPLDYENT